MTQLNVPGALLVPHPSEGVKLGKRVMVDGERRRMPVKVRQNVVPDRGAAMRLLVLGFRWSR